MPPRSLVMEETYNLRSRTLAPPVSDIEGYRPAVSKELIAESARPTFLGKGGDVETEVDVGVSLRPRAGGKCSATTDLGSTEANPTTYTIDTVITDWSPPPVSTVTTVPTVEPPAATAAAVGQQQQQQQHFSFSPQQTATASSASLPPPSHIYSDIAQILVIWYLVPLINPPPRAAGL